MKTGAERSLSEYLGSFISKSKKQAIERVLSNRTRYITIVLEDIYQPHNASAVVRTCDCFGIQDLHIIENINEYTLNPNVTQGSSKWVDIHRYNSDEGDNTKHCLNHLEARGYTLYATSPHESSEDLDQVSFEGKVALVFGKEIDGLSENVLHRASKVVKIPMYGFTESFNLSVSVALCLQTLINKLHKSSVDWRLTSAEKDVQRLNWYRKSVRNAKIHERTFYDKG